MKKIFSTITFALMGLAAVATSYNGNLTVTVNGVQSSQPTTIDIVEQGGKYTLSLKNFKLLSGNNELPVGNIVVDNVPGVKVAGVTMLHAGRNITIAKGDGEGDWTGPMLGEVPIKMSARFNDNGQMATTISIDMAETIGRIDVDFDATGNVFQMPNNNFETWTDATTEPKHWHGFKSATGSFAAMASSTLLKSDDKHSGDYSAVIASKQVFWVIANGTMTNGRLSADAIAAADPKNNSNTDLSLTDTDKNGDPFYTKLYAKPDAIQLWLKFRQGTASEQYPYATVSSVITDGTYYQEPEDKAYNNVVAKAQNKQITTGDWRLLNVPFDYASYAGNQAEAKAILFTVSTNATPGQGSDNDQVWIDDIQLVYNASISGLQYKGKPIAGFNPETETYTIENYEGIPVPDDFMANVEGQSAVLGKIVETTGAAHVAKISVVSGDLKTAKTYVVNFPIKALKGDINGDGKINESDVTVLVNMILSTTPQSATLGDINGDGKIDVSDVTALINIILEKK